MSGLGEYAEKAEKYAEDNPGKVDQAVQRGEQFADKQTGDRYDQQIGQGGQYIEHHFDGNQQGQDQYGQDQDQQYGQDQDQGQYGQN